MNYKFTPDQVQTIVTTLMQFEAAKVYDTIKMIDQTIIAQNEANTELVEQPNK